MYKCMYNIRELENYWGRLGSNVTYIWDVLNKWTIFLTCANTYIHFGTINDPSIGQNSVDLRTFTAFIICHRLYCSPRTEKVVGIVNLESTQNSQAVRMENKKKHPSGTHERKWNDFQHLGRERYTKFYSIGVNKRFSEWKRRVAIRFIVFGFALFI